MPRRRARRRPGGPPFAEVGIAAGVAALHVADHTVVPRRFHLGTHLASAALATAAALATGASPADLGLHPERAPHGMRRGLAAAAAVAAVVGVGAALPATRPWFADRRVLDAGPGEVAFRGLVEIPLGTALYEEVVFRGVGLGLALRRLPPGPAVALTSGLFGLWHVLPSLRDRQEHPATRHRHPAAVTATAVASTAAFGAVLARQRLRTGSVVAPVLTHTATNAVTYLVAAALAGRTRARAGSSPS